MVREKKKSSQALMAHILATWEAEIGRVMVRGQSEKIVWEIPSPK
jgi:hypothetical protein